MRILSKLKFLPLIMFTLLMFISSTFATNYYVDNSGSDVNSGLTGHPWQHAKYALSNAPNGSVIYFTSGQTFSEDNITITNKQNLILAPSSVTKAILKNASNGSNQITQIATQNSSLYIGRDVLDVINSSQITISNLAFYGITTSPPLITNEWAGINIVSINHQPCTNITIVQCEITNVGYGISLYQVDSDPETNIFSNLNISWNIIHDCGYCGILEWTMWSDDVNDSPPVPTSVSSVRLLTNVITANNELYNIYGRPDANSGTGMAFFNIAYWECYSNYVHDCGQLEGGSGGGGAGGIFPVFYCDHVHIWHNEVARIWAKPTGDGVGIDLDRGTIDSIVEGNFVHDCGGAGYYSYQVAGNNIWRWNLGIADGSGLSNTNGYAPANFGQEMDLEDGNWMNTNCYTYIYNNTFIGAFSSFGSGDTLAITNYAIIANNIFGQFTANDPRPCCTGNHQQSVSASATPYLNNSWYFAGNYYQSVYTNASGPTYPFFIVWPTNGVIGDFFSLSDWRGANQETNTGFGSGVAGFAINTGPVGSGSVASNYYLLNSSQLYGTGVNVTNYGIPSVGSFDWFGNVVPLVGNNVGGLVGNGSPIVPYSVTNYGAAGDMVRGYFTTVSNSVLVVFTNVVNNGATVELFGCGPLGPVTTNFFANNLPDITNVISGTNYYYYRQDFYAQVTNVVNGTNLYLNVAPSKTMLAYGYVGTNNSTAFQLAINNAPLNGNIDIPSGSYLIVGPTNFANVSIPDGFEAYPAVTIYRGDITLQGHGTNTIIVGSGGWQVKGSYAYRGTEFWIAQTITNSGTITFDSLVMDGGVPIGNAGYSGIQPNDVASGMGWDSTHHAVVDLEFPIHNNLVFINCWIHNHRGEQILGLPNSDSTIGSAPHLQLINTVFSDGEATCFGSWGSSFSIVNCVATNILQLCEVALMNVTNQCFISGNYVSGYANLMSLNLTASDSPAPTILINNNTFLNGSGNGIMFQYCRNVIISNNFFGSSGAIVSGAFGAQAPPGRTASSNANFTITGNTFSNNFYCVAISGGGLGNTYNLLFSNNFCKDSGGSAEVITGYGWSTNVVAVNNRGSNTTAYFDSVHLSGQFVLDNNNVGFGSFANYYITNVSYGNGQNQTLYPYYGNPNYVITGDTAVQVPPTATMNLTNTYSGPVNLILASGNIALGAGASENLYWNGTAWVTSLPPPANISVYPRFVIKP